MGNKILVLDFGSQYNQLIVRTVREAHVYSELVYPEKNIVDVIKKDSSIKGIIFSGGPNSVYERGAPQIDKEIYNLGIPILGICYGMQLIAYQLGGTVCKCNKKEYGHANINCKSSLLFKKLANAQNV
jgi:GMP synthase (glutamine-hydrolysing)